MNLDILRHVKKHSNDLPICAIEHSGKIPEHD